MRNHYFLATLLLGTLFLTGCGEDEDKLSSMKKKKYIIVQYGLNSGICESSFYRNELKKKLNGIETLEVKERVTCESLGKNFQNCQEQALGNTDTTCLVGANP